MSQSNHNRMKTEPCISPESPFMRKPSRQMLKKLNFKKSKETNNQQASFIPPQQNISYIHPQRSSGSFGPTLKLKKTTIQLSSFKIMHQNMLLKNQLQDLKKENRQLIDQNQFLKNQLNSQQICSFEKKIITNPKDKDNFLIQKINRKFNNFKKQQPSSPILTFSSLNSLNNRIKMVSPKANLTNLDQKQNNFNSQNSKNNSIVSFKNSNKTRKNNEENDEIANFNKKNLDWFLLQKNNSLKTFSSCRTLFDTSSIQCTSQQSGSRIKQLSFSKIAQTQFSFSMVTAIRPEQSKNLQQQFNSYMKATTKIIQQMRAQLQSYKQKVQILENSIQKQKIRSNKLQTQNQALYLHIQLNKRKLLQKEEKIKKYQNRQKKQKLFQLSSESDSFY